MTRSMAFTMTFLSAFAAWGCGGATDEASDSTEATHTASDEISTDSDGGTTTTTDGGTKTRSGDGGEECEDGSAGKPGK